MEIVIKIPEEEYQKIINHTKEILDESSFIEPKYLYRAVIDGTPLPEHHGRLIDADDITLIDEQFYVPSDYYVAESAIDNAPTIIERRDTE